jgi:excisionase family DNA binding protein
MSILGTELTRTKTKSGLLNRKQIAYYIGVSERTVSNMMRKRLIPVLKIGKTVRFDPPKVKAALEKYEIEAI